MLSLIVAMDEQGLIGIHNRLPWRLSSDLKNFKRITLGKPVVMGRKTYESIGRPLPGRENIIMTRNKNYQADGATVFNALEDMYAHCSEVDEALIIGGAALYRQTLDKAARIYLTEVHTRLAGDAFFPDFDRSRWREVERREFGSDEKNEFAFSLVVLERV